MSSMDEQVPQNTRLLKIIVIVLGILLVVGFVVVIATIIIRLGSLGEESTANSAPAAAIAATPETFRLPLDGGETIQNFTLDGSRMAVHVNGPNGARMLIVDLTSGTVIQTYTVTASEE